MDGNHDARVDRQLDAIRVGGSQLVVMARQRIAVALDALDAGDFVGTGEALLVARHFVTALAHAQTHIAIAGTSRLVRCLDVEVGMELTHLGEVTAKEATPCIVCEQHITLHIGDDHQMRLHGNEEVYVVNGRA